MASTSIHKVIKVLHSDKYLQSYSKAVRTEFELGKNKLKKFFINKGFNNEQAEALIYSLRRALYHINRDKAERKRLDSEVLFHLRAKQKLEIADLDKLLCLKSLLKKQTGNDYIFFKTLKDFLVAKLTLKVMPRAGGNIFLRLSLTPIFWKLSDFGIGQSKQISLVYDLFKYYELDDYGTESEKNGTYVGETEQKDRIRTQFQQPAMKYFDEFDQHLGWMVSSKKAVL